ncbi:hypothetical protein N658DRAFT_492465 [Parathielavia hyrcaniae]|uniref:DUF6594 domain-containing protein n=1 Tax=Parathielavia hyrcaniae TaxID=113614 RepID=A0AAN6T4D9_9PEZI|nr:hypothetical protein N658DRAFT_492465 [Parathielavia hyrcaniae]
MEGNSNPDIERQPHGLGESYLDLLKDASHREVLYEAKSAQFDRALKVNLAALQRIVICMIQKQLVDNVGAMVSNGTFVGLDAAHLCQVKVLLAEYSQAVRNWDLMVGYAAKAGHNLSKDPFLLSSEERLSYELMRSAGLLGLPFADSYEHEGNARLPLGQRRNATIGAVLGRFVVALLGGVALIGPMLLMQLHNDLTTKLATTSVAVFLVAAFMALYSTGPPEVIVSVVAAYAAVLVVFVGANR